MTPIPQSDWQWFGVPMHFIASESCQYHLATRIGPWVVSSVGGYVSPLHPDRFTEIGYARLYEVMVFRAVPCQCGGKQCEGWQIDPTELDMAPANSATEATANHMAMCAKWAAVEKAEPVEDLS